MANDFSIDVQQLGSIHVLTTHGYINNQGGEEIAKAYHQAAETGAKRFLLNLADSPIVNSIGVSVLIELLEETLENEGKMAFCECAPIIAKTFQIMGLTQYAGLYETQAQALDNM